MKELLTPPGASCLSATDRLEALGSVTCSLFETINKPVCILRPRNFVYISPVCDVQWISGGIFWSDFVISFLAPLPSNFIFYFCCSLRFPTALIQNTCCADAMHCGLLMLTLVYKLVSVGFFFMDFPQNDCWTCFVMDTLRLLRHFLNEWY